MIPPGRQRGAALLLLLLLLLVGGGIALIGQLKRTEPEAAASRRTARALAVAKEALLGWSVVDGASAPANQNPGRLPCPDQDNDGDAEGAACGQPYIGWLPWRTLATDDLRDRSNERLWLLLDAAFRSGGGILNSTIQPTLTLDGRPVVAVIVAPGAPLSQRGQTRLGSGPFQARSVYGHYVEGFAPASASLSTMSGSADTNDQVLAITPGELFGLVTRRLAGELAQLNPPGPSGYTATSLGDLVKPAVWVANEWDAAVASFDATPTEITIRFKHCGIVYRITGPTAVARSQPAC